MPKESSTEKIRDSRTALVCGQAFQRLAEKLIPSIWAVEEGTSLVTPDGMGNVVVCATNLAFALELYLKGLLTQLDLPVPEVHDLRRLYDTIPQPVRTLVESIYDKVWRDEVRRLGGHVCFTFAKGPLEGPRWNDCKVSPALPDVLARSQDLFLSWRYVFEFSQPEGSPYQFHRFEYGFLRCAAEVLRVELTARLYETGERPLPNLLAGQF